MSEEIKSDYGSSNIQILEGLEAVRKRPGMYIGSTGPRGLHHLVWEIVDNAIDEALAGYCTHIEVEILPGDVIQVTDNGRGIPVGVHAKTGESALEAVFTILHAGGKFDGKSYKVSGGLHGVGASVVNALSEWLEVTVRQNGKVYHQHYKRGKKSEKLQEIGVTSIEDHGTSIKFKADAEIFQETQVYDFETLRNRLQQSAFLNKGLKISLTDSRNANKKEIHYCYEGGISEYVEYLNKVKTPIHPMIIYCSGTIENIEVEIALQYTEDYSANVYSFINNIYTPEGGTHEEGFRNSLTRTLNTYAKANNLFRKDESFTGDDVREGLTAIISCRHPDPQFEGQTKAKLGNTEVRRITSQIFSEKFDTFLKENPSVAKNIIEKAIIASRARNAARMARDAKRKNPLDSLGFASKLADCRCKDPAQCEIYIVEGDSAGGSAKLGRNSEFQAILPLRGKVLNVEKARLDRILGNKEIISMIQAFGTGIGDDFNSNNARYHKIVIMTDADVDGAHIRTLLLTFFYRFMKPLVELGYIYIAQPPLYKVQQSKRVEYAYSDEELQKILETFPKASKPVIQRYKGLGEMDAVQLWETTMDPEVRTLLQVSVDDAIEADTVFSMLMGDDVEPRREFIEENAIYVENLDI